LKEGRVSHAYLFCGPRGTGKTSTARLIAKALNCLAPAKNGSPCNQCEICLQINDGRVTDIIEIDAASNRGIDEIRDLREKISFSPNIAKYKIYIIDEVHMLTKEAFNALLKTLEEPPAHAYFILATTEIYKVPDTIISRCQRFDFHRMNKAILVERLKFIAESENVEYEVEAFESIADRVGGGMRDAIGLLEQSIKNGKISLENLKNTLGLTENQAIVDLFETVYAGDMSSGLKKVNDIHNQGYDLEQMSKDFLEYARKEMLCAVAGADITRTARIVSIIDSIQDAKSKIKNSAIPQLALEIAIIKLCGAPKETEEYSTTLEELESSNENDFLNTLRKNWDKIVLKIKNPAIRASFKEARAVSIKDNVLLLHYSTAFHLEKTSSALAMSAIENAIEETYGKKLGLKSELRKVDLAPTVDKRQHSGLTTDNTSKHALPEESPAETENTKSSTIEESPEDALSVFKNW